MNLSDKLEILTDSAKYDVACTSSGTDKMAPSIGMGSAFLCGICHSFAADGRCVSLLKVLLGNACVYDCKYCVNRKTNDINRAVFTPDELAGLTIEFYRRNYIEGLFLSSAVLKSPDYTMELMIKTIDILRNQYHFHGYIHAKAIPGADKALIKQMGMLVERMSVNIELPSNESLQLLAPDKTKSAIFSPMRQIKEYHEQNHRDLVVYKKAPRFTPAGQSTQMIIGASPEADGHILRLTENLYRKYSLKRVFFSAYTPIVADSLLPATDSRPPLLREHRLYQADWLLRYYKFSAAELLTSEEDNFNPFLDPKANWAVRHPEFFPVEINRADYHELLRVPGLGVKSAARIMTARKLAMLDFADLKKLGVVLKRAQFFITCKGRSKGKIPTAPEGFLSSLMSAKEISIYRDQCNFGQKQLTLFELNPPAREDVVACLTGQM